MVNVTNTGGMRTISVASSIQETEKFIQKMEVQLLTLRTYVNEVGDKVDQLVSDASKDAMIFCRWCLDALNMRLRGWTFISPIIVFVQSSTHTLSLNISIPSYRMSKDLLPDLRV
jgi:hypothetical protein